MADDTTRRLLAEQAGLVSQEAALAAQLADVQCALDRVTGKLDAVSQDAQRAATAKAIIRAGKIRRRELNDDGSVIQFPRKDR
jgi:hypothetical protein